MKKNFCFLLLTGSLTATSAFSRNFSHQATQKEMEEATKRNLELQKQGKESVIPKPFQPVPDFADFSYVLMSSETEGVSEVSYLRKTIASNLPANVKLVILTTKSQAAQVRATYERWINPDRLIIASDNDPNNENGFWARDSFPVPVWDESTHNAKLVALKYYRTFTSSKTVATAVGGSVSLHPETFVGGNLLADEDGNCFSINSQRLFGNAASTLQNRYGCKTMRLLRHIVGLGDVDEVLKPMGNKHVLTNQTEYKTQFEGLGYSVTMLPIATGGEYRTYVNSLIVGDAVFMPKYGVPEDQQATAVYEKLGYRVFPIPSNYLSDRLLGSVHCQTMAYPQMDLGSLMKALDATPDR